MKTFKVTGGLGRLQQFSKTVEVQAKDEDRAYGAGMTAIRQLITEQDFNGDSSARMLSKVINIGDVEEI